MKRITKQNIKEAMLKTGIKPFGNNEIDFFDVIEEGMTMDEAKAVIMREFKDDTFHNGLCRRRGIKLISAII